MPRSKPRVKAQKRKRTLRAKFVREFTIDRAKWNPGQLYGPGYLRHPDAGQCCLGIYGDACKVEYSTLQTMPHRPGSSEAINSGQRWNPHLFREIEHRTHWGQLITTSIADVLADVNDNKNITQKWREQKIRNLFALVGVTVHFTGKLRPVPKAK